MNAQQQVGPPVASATDKELFDRIAEIASRGAAVANALATDKVLEELNRIALSGIAYDLLTKFEEIQELIITAPPSEEQAQE